ncbi:MAG: hypothetical protein LBV30_01490 [Propionibacteriaceae bacterium]|nr:hypothetical protein [Propionibacteriaceae bacterium]
MALKGSDIGVAGSMASAASVSLSRAQVRVGAGAVSTDAAAEAGSAEAQADGGRTGGGLTHGEQDASGLAESGQDASVRAGPRAVSGLTSVQSASGLGTSDLASRPAHEPPARSRSAVLSGGQIAYILILLVAIGLVLGVLLRFFIRHDVELPEAEPVTPPFRLTVVDRQWSAGPGPGGQPLSGALSNHPVILVPTPAAPVEITVKLAVDLLWAGEQIALRVALADKSWSDHPVKLSYFVADADGERLVPLVGDAQIGHRLVVPGLWGDADGESARLTVVVRLEVDPDDPRPLDPTALPGWTIQSLKVDLLALLDADGPG